MNLMSRLLSSLFLLTALLLILSGLPAGWMLELGAPVDLSASLMSLLESQRRGEQLSRQFETTLAREVAKSRISRALTSGRLTLIEAAVCFRSLYEDPKSWHNPNRPRPERDDAEGWCREVIEWAVSELDFDHSPGPADALRQRLEAELQEELECYGVVTLPE